MPFPVALVPVAISAVQSLLKLRGRVDSILSVKAAADPLPFALPPLPDAFDYTDTDKMIAFFAAQGAPVLLAAGKVDEFEAFRTLAAADRTPARTDPLLRLYYMACGTAGAAPGQSSSDPAKAVVDFYLVESCRLSNNPAYIRILLTTADTLLEFAGSNASLFISNPKTASIVGTLLREFAGRQDFDDQNLDRIFRTLLGSAVVTALEFKGDLPDHPALVVLYSALGEVRSSKGDDFAARIISAEGFTAVISSYFKVAATDPGFERLLAKAAGADRLDDKELAVVRGAFSATLTTLGENFEQVLRDPAALKAVLEAAITAAAANAAPLIRTLGDDRPVLAAVLEAVAGAVATRKALLDTLGNGELIGEIYRVSLEAVARTPDLDGDGVASVVERIVGALSDELSKDSLKETIAALKQSRGEAYVNRLLSRTVGVFAEAPELVVGDNAYAKAVLGSVLGAGASLLKDGLDVDDLIAIVQEGVRSAAGNLHLIEMDDTLRAMIGAFGQSVADGDLKAKFGTAENRKNALLVAIQAMATSPQVWAKFDERDLVVPVVNAVFEGLKTDPANILTGPAMVEGLRAVLHALNGRGLTLLEGLDKPADGTVKARVQEAITGTITSTLQALDEDIGRKIAAEDAPAYLRRVLSAAFAKGLDAKTAVAQAIKDARAQLDAAA